jgi:hypothetical protein
MAELNNPPQSKIFWQKYVSNSYKSQACSALSGERFRHGDWVVRSELDTHVDRSEGSVHLRIACHCGRWSGGQQRSECC